VANCCHLKRFEVVKLAKLLLGNANYGTPDRAATLQRFETWALVISPFRRQNSHGLYALGPRNVYNNIATRLHDAR